MNLEKKRMSYYREKKIDRRNRREVPVHSFYNYYSYLDPFAAISVFFISCSRNFYFSVKNFSLFKFFETDEVNTRIYDPERPDTSSEQWVVLMLVARRAGKEGRL